MADPLQPGWTIDATTGQARPMTPVEHAAYWDEFSKTPYGQRYFDDQRKQGERKAWLENAAIADRQSQIEMQRKQIEAQVGKYAADKWATEQNVKLAREKMQLDRELGLGDLEVKRGQLDVAKGRLGLDYTQTATNYAQNPQNYFAEADFLRGASQRQDVPVFMEALSGQNQAAFQSRGAEPTPANIQDIQDSFVSGVMPGTKPVGQKGGTDPLIFNNAAQPFLGRTARNYYGGNQDDTAINAIGYWADNPNLIADQGWESLTDDERGLTLSAVRKRGGTPSGFLSGYYRSRIGQGNIDPRLA